LRKENNIDRKNFPKSFKSIKNEEKKKKKGEHNYTTSERQKQ